MPTPNVFVEIDQLDPILSASVSDNDLLVLFDLDAPISPRMRKLSIANARNLFGGGGGGGGSVDLSNYYTKPQTDTLLNAKAALVHTHVIDDVTGLTAALAGKAESVHTHVIADVSGLQADLNSRATNTALTSGLAGKADVSHTHTIANVTNLQTTLDGKASSVHTHVIADVANLQTTLDGKAASSHTHTIANVTNLQTSLDGKAATVHTHVIADVTGLTAALAGKSDTTHTHSNATTSAAGFMSAADKVKLDGVQSLQLNKMSGFWHWLTTATISGTQGISGGNSGLSMYSFVTGTGATVAANNTVDVTKPGVLVMTLGITPTGRAGVTLASGNSLTSANFQQILAANVVLAFDVYVRVPVLSTVLESFRQFYGWSDSLTPYTGNIAYIYIDENSLVTAVSTAAGLSTFLPLGSITANQWFRFRMTATNTLITYQVNNNTPVTISTTISTAGMTFHATALKTLGTTSRTVEVDYTYVDITYPAQF